MTLAAWLDFFGTWLLVAGPLYQGVLELLEEDINREDSAELFEGIAPPGVPSSWWWLLPPAMVVLRRQRTTKYHKLVLSRMTPDQRASRAGFLQKATGWFIVAAGASCLAVGATWELAEQMEWSPWLFAASLALLVALVAAGTIKGGAQARRMTASSPNPDAS
jgi:hypothetical protein